MTAIRISLGRFDPDRTEAVAILLAEAEDTLVPAIRAMPGLLGFWAGIDRANGTMTNVSLWQSEAEAQGMATLAPMLALAQSFAAAGVRFERPITTHSVLWQIAGPPG